MKLTYQIEIRRSPQDVFAFLSDFSNDPRWRSGVLEIRPVGKETAPGGIWSRQIEVRKVLGRIIETRATITHFEPPLRLTVERASGPIRPAATYELEGQGSATRLRFRLDVTFSGLALIAWPLTAGLLNMFVHPGLGREFLRLKKVLEEQG